MARVLRPVRRKKGASRRPAPGDGGTTTREGPHLTIVRSSGHQPPPLHGMWHNDPIGDPVAYTNLGDWPTDHEFEPLIAGAVAAGDHLLAAQLESDRAFCAAARAQLSGSSAVPTDTPA
jgi:hypothetical protein